LQGLDTNAVPNTDTIANANESFAFQQDRFSDKAKRAKRVKSPAKQKIRTKDPVDPKSALDLFLKAST
jgi:hypothetical protein